LHIELLYGANQHHITEGIFKSAAKAFSAASRVSERIEGVLSTKGMI
jgi:imidazoleglycerol-phosphate dehydratase